MINDLDFLEAGFSEELSNAVDFESLEEGVIKDLISSLKRKFKKAGGKRSDYKKKIKDQNKPKSNIIVKELPKIEQEARHAYLKEFYNKMVPVFNKILNKYPKVKSILGHFDYNFIINEYAEDFCRYYDNDVCFGFYEIYNHPDIDSGKLNARFNLDNGKLSIWDDEEFCDQLNEAPVKICEALTALGYGKVDFDCDWDGGYFDIQFDMNKVKEFVDAYCKNHPEAKDQQSVDEFAIALMECVDKGYSNSFDLFAESLTEEPYPANIEHDKQEVRDTDDYFNPSELEKDLVNGQDEVEDVTANSEQDPSVFDANGITQTSNNIIDKEDDITRNPPTIEDPTDGHGTLEKPVVNNEAFGLFESKASKMTKEQKEEAYKDKNLKIRLSKNKDTIVGILKEVIPIINSYLSKIKYQKDKVNINDVISCHFDKYPSHVSQVYIELEYPWIDDGNNEYDEWYDDGRAKEFEDDVGELEDKLNSDTKINKYGKFEVNTHGSYWAIWFDIKKDLLDYSLKEEYHFTEAMVISGKDIYYNKDAFVNGDINLCFITGLSGSGKSSMAQTMTRKAENLEHYDMDEVIFNKQNHPDEAWYKDRGDMIHKFFFAGPGKKYFIDRKDIDEVLHMDEDKYREEITKTFVDFAISYANSHKNIKFIIEGVWLYRFIPASKFKPYALCIKGTSAATSIYRASKRDKDSIGKLKRAGSWVKDEAKLNAYRKMYARSDETVRESNNYYSTSSSGIDLEYYSAYQSYLESTIDNEFKLQNLLVKDYALTESNIILEARIQDTVKTKWETFTNFILRIIDRFTATIEKLLINNNGFLNKYKSNIVDTDPSDTIEYEYVGDYFEAVDRILNTPLPVFNYERDAQWLRQDGYEGAVKDFMAGKNFKYSSDQDLAAQFKNWFLATERGTSKGKLSNLNFKKMFDYCFNYGKIQNSVKHDQNSIEQTRNVILNAVNKELRERGENVTQNQTTQPQTNTTTNGGSENNNAGANNNTQNTSSTKESAIWVNLSEAEGDNADNGNSNNGVKITTNTNDVKDDNGNTVKQNTVAPGKSSTTEQDINLIVGKWITLCRCFTTAKLTAIQQVAKDFMNLIRAHLRSQNIKDTENPEEAAKGNKTEADQQNNNKNNNEKK